MKRIILILLIIISVNCYSQKERWIHGIGYGHGFTYTGQNYKHDNFFVRAHFYHTPKQECDDFKWQLAIEPEINTSVHRDINSTREIEMSEYSLTVGGIARQFLGKNDKWSVYGMLSTGIVYLDTETLRQDSGGAFINTCAIGASYKIRGVFLELRPSLRHVSTAGFNRPNYGLDTANIEFGIFFPLTDK